VQLAAARVASSRPQRPPWRYRVSARVDNRDGVGVGLLRRAELRADPEDHVRRVGVDSVIDQAVGESRENVDFDPERLKLGLVLRLRSVDRAAALAFAGDPVAQKCARQGPERDRSERAPFVPLRERQTILV
jgi:hypothetical protein